VETQSCSHRTLRAKDAEIGLEPCGEAGGSVRGEGI